MRKFFIFCELLLYSLMSGDAAVRFIKEFDDFPEVKPITVDGMVVTDANGNSTEYGNTEGLEEVESSKS